MALTEGVRDNVKSKPFGFLMYGKAQYLCGCGYCQVERGKVGYAVVVRNHNGMITAAGLDFGVYTGDIDISEAEVLCFTLWFSNEIDLSLLFLESNSLRKVHLVTRQHRTHFRLSAAICPES